METLFGKKQITTISFSQDEIIADIMELYDIDRFHLDCTYSKGVFWKNLPQPIHKTDLFPQTSDTLKASSDELPFVDSTIRSAMFDPVFTAGCYNKKGNIYRRFGGFKRMTDLWEYYNYSLIELYRVLKNDGILVVKCQDTVSENKQYFSHCHIMNLAINTGFYPQDMFLLLSKNRMVAPNHHNQVHARKYHSYFWVFRKSECKVNYHIP